MITNDLKVYFRKIEGKIEVCYTVSFLPTQGVNCLRTVTRDGAISAPLFFRLNFFDYGRFLSQLENCGWEVSRDKKDWGVY